MDKLKNYLVKIGCKEVDKKLALFDIYRQRILEANNSVNLTRIIEPEEFETRHFIDSLLPCLTDVFQDAQNVIDVGSGAGFPGVPIAIAFPEKKITLLDSSAKRMRVVGDIIAEMDLKNVRAIHTRAEDAAHGELRETFSLCVSRAVADLSVLTEYCLPLLAVGGAMIAYKGADVSRETSAASRALETMGGRIAREETHDESSRETTLIYIEKFRTTPPEYPRRPGKPIKSPL